MKWYCDKCKRIHSDEELCPRIKMQLKTDPKLLADVSNFTIVAGEYALISNQVLDEVAQDINKIANTNLGYEGTRQFARDIQVFRRLNEEAFSRSGVFASPENAKSYLQNVTKIAEKTPKTMQAFDSKLTGSAQEVDWLRWKQGELSNLWEKSSLLNGNAPGVDGETVNRFTGKTISRTTIKASACGENTQKNIVQNVHKVEKAINKEYATDKDIVFGTTGTKDAVNKVGLSNPVIEKNTPKQVSNSNDRLKQKIMEGQATTHVTVQQLGKKMAQGAVVGAAVGVTISGITNYIRYRNGEITSSEAFKEVSEDTLKGAITGGGMAAVSIFLPGGAIGYIAGMAIGIYFSKTCTNLLDEIYGKGAYGAILDASGYVYGMTCNLAECMKKIEKNNKMTNNYIAATEQIKKDIDENFDIFEKMKGE